MGEAGDLISDAAWAFNFRRVEPTCDAPTRLVVLLHGADGDELQWAAIACALDRDTLAVLPRGPRSIAGERIGWFREGFDDGTPQANVEELDDSLRKLDEFIAQLQERHAVSPDNTWLVGFSQGGELAAALALTRPACVAGWAMVSARLVPDLESTYAEPDALAHLRALLVHGRDDAVLPIELLHRTQAALTGRAVTHHSVEVDGAHALDEAMVDAVRAWLRRDAA